MESHKQAALTFALPFGPSPGPPRDEVPVDAVEGSYSYALVKSAPDVPVEEVEDASTASVEVMILWDTSVLHVQHLTPPRSFYVGEECSKSDACDFFIPCEKLGTTRAPIVLADRGGSVSVVLPAGASGTIEIAGQPAMTVRQAIEQRRAQPCVELSGAHQLVLPPGSKANVDLGGLAFQVSSGNAGRVVAGHFQIDAQGLLYAGISLAVHAALLGAMAFFMPSLGATDEEGISQEQQYLLQQYLQAAAEKEMQERVPEAIAENDRDSREGGTGARAKLEEGSMGSPNTRQTGYHYAVKGPAENPDPHVARQAALLDAGSFGTIALLSGDPSAPTAAWGRDEALGNDSVSVRGNMWGADAGESFGAGGLGLSGTGEGGCGGCREGIGLGAIGTIGRGAGATSGAGFGSGHGRLRGAHHAEPPVVRPGSTVVSGRLPPEIIQRVVRQNFGRFRLCYENGLRASPNLTGRVAVRFVIGRDGGVSSAGNGGSDMPDANVTLCVVRAFYGLSFPQPEGGVVAVTYPILFAPGG